MRRNKGFTLVEIMIVVAIIGLLAAIAVPSFLKARDSARRNACINNMRQIDGAKDQYALEYGGVATTVLFSANVGLYIKDMGKCFCPNNAGTNHTFVMSYEIMNLTQDPTCVQSASNENHRLNYSGPS